MRRAFDHYMIMIRAARHPKFTHLSLEERYAFFLGVLSLAAQSPKRGLLLAGNLPVTPAHVASECGVTDDVAASAMEKLRQVGVLEPDDEGRDWVHDFSDHNPAPKVDATNAERQRRYRNRHVTAGNAVTSEESAASRNGAVTSRNALEVEVEVEETPLKPPRAVTQPPRPRRARRNPGTEGVQDQPVSLQQREAERDRLAEQAAFCAHFPNTPKAIVLNVRRRVIAAGLDPTIEAVRSELEDPQL